MVPVVSGWLELNYFIISEGLLGYVEKCDIEPGYKTDHSMISIDPIILKNDRHRGFWKLNMAHQNLKNTEIY